MTGQCFLTLVCSVELADMICCESDDCCRPPSLHCSKGVPEPMNLERSGL